LPATMPDVNGDGKMDRNELRTLFKGRGMTDGEMKDLFNTIDFNNDNMIDELEWSEFHRIFINGFQEECDDDKDYLLSMDELTACFELETEFAGFDSVIKKNEDLVEWVFWVLEP